MPGLNAKAIRSTLAKKFNEFVASIEDANVRDLVANNSIITGGCIASMLLGEPVNDYDIYFTDKRTALAVAKYYVSRFNPGARKGIPCAMSVDESGDRVRIVIQSVGVASEAETPKPYQYFEARPEGEAGEFIGEIMKDAGQIEDVYQGTEAAALKVEDDGKPKYRPVFMSTNAITLSHRVQLVLRFFGDAEEIHRNYDFEHCTNYWLSADGKLTLRSSALEALLAKELRYVGSKYPICSIIRLRKFIRRGWTINAGQILKMAMQVSELDLNDLEVLQNQLTGVDAAYFSEVIEKLKEKDATKINSAYLCEIIDRMF